MTRLVEVYIKADERPAGSEVFAFYDGVEATEFIAAMVQRGHGIREVPEKHVGLVNALHCNSLTQAISKVDSILAIFHKNVEQGWPDTWGNRRARHD